MKGDARSGLARQMNLELSRGIRRREPELIFVAGIIDDENGSNVVITMARGHEEAVSARPAC
jgi:hypothetical protein